jgi:large subunit ribosomal protein L19
MANILEQIEQKEIRSDHPNFRVGDTIRVHFRIKEGDKERTQTFEGVCLARRGEGNRESIVVRKISFSMGVERIFPLNSPRIEKIEIAQSGHVRRAKLYYLRDLTGKKARIKERQDFRVLAGNAQQGAASAEG